jgi:hypothetical protein
MMCGAPGADAADAVGARRVVVPFSLGTSPLAAWYGIVALAVGFCAAHVLWTLLLAACTKPRRKEWTEAGEVVTASEGEGSELPVAKRFFAAARTALFPKLSVGLLTFAFQGIVTESLQLVAALDSAAEHRVAGAAALCLCLAFMAATQHVAAAAAAARGTAAAEVVFLPYECVALQVPRHARRFIVPRGFWRGKLTLLGRLRLFEMFDARHVKWVSTIYAVRAVVLGVFAVLRPRTAAGCTALYLALAAVFFVFAAVFAAARPHRALFDDVAAGVVHLLCCALCLVLALGPADAVMPLYLTVVCVAIVFIALTMVRLLMEHCVWLAAEGAGQRQKLAAAAAGGARPPSDGPLTAFDVCDDSLQFDAVDAASVWNPLNIFGRAFPRGPGTPMQLAADTDGSASGSSSGLPARVSPRLLTDDAVSEVHDMDDDVAQMSPRGRAHTIAPDGSVSGRPRSLASTVAPGTRAPSPPGEADLLELNDVDDDADLGAQVGHVLASVGTHVTGRNAAAADEMEVLSINDDAGSNAAAAAAVAGGDDLAVLSADDDDNVVVARPEIYVLARRPKRAQRRPSVNNDAN